MLIHNTEIRVRFCDTDKMQFLHHAKYAEYFESARTEMLRDYGIPYKEIEQRGYEMPVTELMVKYKSPAYYDDLLVVECTLKDYKGARVHIDYKIYNKENKNIVAEGFTVLVFVKPETKRPVKPPQFFTEKIAEILNP
ncbi:MAG TPA: thioesterase family protein [Ignavibacteriaceae bacterium]|nr:thioesterase family protein [Ignavibacteriaceae bacterium]